MSYFNYREYTSRRGLNLTAANGCIRFETPTTTPTTTTDERVLYVNSSNQLIFDDGVSTTALGSSGVVSFFGLNDAYDDNPSITVDSAAVTFAGSHATNNVFAVTGSAATTGNLIDLTNGGSGKDIDGTASAWYIASDGAADFLSVTSSTISSAGTTNLVLETNDGTNSSIITITDAANGAITFAMNGTGKVVISGTTETNTGFQLTNGDAVISDGSLTITDDDNAATVTVTTTGNSNCLTIVADSVATGNVIDINGDGVTSGALLHLDMTAADITSGKWIDCYDNAATVFAVAAYGATTILGNTTGTNSLVLTAGDAVLSDGAVSVTNSADAATLTIVADAQVATNVVDINADGVTTGVLLHLDTSSAGFAGKYIQCYDGAADDFSVGVDGATIITTSAAGTIGLTITHAGTTGDAMQITCTALTTGDALQITQTAETFAAGELLKLTNTEDGDFSATPKTGNVASITSSATMKTNSATMDYDTLLISRSDIANQLTKTLTAQGSVLKLMHTATDTAGTCTASVIGLEIVMADGGTAAPTGTAVDIISVGVAAKALNIASASTTVSDVLITGSGVKANNKASLEVVNTGATAAGGSILRVINTGTPAAATSYLVDLDYGGATMTNNPTTVYINAKDSTASSVLITGSGAIAAGNGTLEINSTAAGAAGAVLTLSQDSASPAAADVIGAIHFYGVDDAAADQQYAKIECKLTDVAAASTDADLIFSVVQANAVVQMLQLDSDVAGIVVGTAAAAATVTSNGAYDLTISTNSTAANEPKIVLTDGAAGDITLTAGGTSGEVAIASALKFTPQAIVNANTAIDVITTLTTIANNAGSTHVLADGVVGQIKTIVCSVYTGDAVITPTNFVGTTITLNAAGDSWTGVFVGTEWTTLALGGTAAVA
jgi:hypothetical protein